MSHLVEHFANKVLWNCRGVSLDFAEGPVVMGVLNVTPDSFSDGGRYPDAVSAANRAKAMVKEGARIIDIGGESTRPGADPVPAEVELERVLPVIERVAAETEALISIDTSKARVAVRALEAGAHIVNDVSALTADAGMPGVVAESGAGCILMHMRGTPRTMQKAPVYDDVVGEVSGYLESRVLEVSGYGISVEAIAVDPGIGFGKSLEHNLELLGAVGRFAVMGRPVIAGASRKSFLGAITGRDVDARLPAGLAVTAWCVLQGVSVMRVHDVAETSDVLKVLSAIQRKGKDAGLAGGN